MSTTETEWWRPEPGSKSEQRLQFIAAVVTIATGSFVLAGITWALVVSDTGRIKALLWWCSGVTVAGVVVLSRLQKREHREIRFARALGSSCWRSGKPYAEWDVFYSFGDGPDEGSYDAVHPIEQMSFHLTTLAYDMNDGPLTFGHGAPLRLRNENQLGFKQVKWVRGIDFTDIGGGYGGYNQDHEFFVYRQSI